MAVPERPVVLVVDDDAITRAWVSDALADAYTVVTADNTRDVPTLVAEVQPACILLDLVIQPHNGLDVLAQLRRAGHTAPVVLMSATVPRHRENERAMERVLSQEVFLAKPFELDVLRTVVAREIALGAREA